MIASVFKIYTHPQSNRSKYYMNYPHSLGYAWQY